MARSTWLPGWYLAGFRAPALPGEGAPAAWVYRAPIGAWARSPVEPPGAEFHFNDVSGGELDGLAPLGEELEAVGRAVAPLLPRLEAGEPAGAAARAALARFAALCGVRNARRAQALPLAEARAGVAALEATLGDMGFVYWRAPEGSFFVGSSSPFHAAFPRTARDETVGFGLTHPSVELTLTLAPRLALHATWRRRGEAFRTATEEAALELNGRSCLASRAYLVAPAPQVPG